MSLNGQIPIKVDHFIGLILLMLNDCYQPKRQLSFHLYAVSESLR